MGRHNRKLIGFEQFLDRDSKLGEIQTVQGVPTCCAKRPSNEHSFIQSLRGFSDFFIHSFVFLPTSAPAVPLAIQVHLTGLGYELTGILRKFGSNPHWNTCWVVWLWLLVSVCEAHKRTWRAVVHYEEGLCTRVKYHHIYVRKHIDISSDESTGGILDGCTK